LSSKAVNVSENHIDDIQDIDLVVPDSPHKWQLYEYHLVDHIKPFPDVPRLIACVNLVVRYVWTFGRFSQYSSRNDGNGSE
jgi:hypothetical protein